MASNESTRKLQAPPLSPDQTRIVRRESAISVIANTVIGGIVSLVVYGTRGSVPVRGFSVFTLEFIPQTFMVTLVSVLIPGVIAARAVRNGKVLALAMPRRAPLIPLALMLASAAVVALAGGVVALCLTVAPEAISAPFVLAIKALYGAVIALCVTPFGVRAGLASVKAGRDAASNAGLALANV